MEINVKGTDLELTDALRVYVDEKIAPLGKFFGKIDTSPLYVDIELARTTRHHRHGNVFKADVTIRAPQKTLKASAEGEDIRAAIDIVKDKLHLEIKKYKETHPDL